MSATLMDRLEGHLQTAGLLDGYTIRFYRWSDQDLQGNGQLIMFRMTGTSGSGAHVIQRPDVSIHMLCGKNQVKSGDDRMLAILQYIRANFETEGIINMWPVAPYTGPNYLENNRAMFELVVRCVTSDH